MEIEFENFYGCEFSDVTYNRAVLIYYYYFAMVMRLKLF